MINGIIFNQAFWIKRTPEVANKLTNYDNLQNQLQKIKGTWTWSSSVETEPDVYYQNQVEVTITDNNVSASINVLGNSLGIINLTKK